MGDEGKSRFSIVRRLREASQQAEDEITKEAIKSIADETEEELEAYWGQLIQQASKMMREYEEEVADRIASRAKAEIEEMS